MEKPQEVHAIKVAIIREQKEYKDITLPSPQKTGTGYQRQTYAKVTAEEIYEKHFK